MQMLVEQLDFFPVERAMSLAKVEEDETDTKLEELNDKLDLLVRKMKEQVNAVWIEISWNRFRAGDCNWSAFETVGPTCVSSVSLKKKLILKFI